MSKYFSHTFSKFLGINNIDPSSRSVSPTESTYLSVASNIDIDKTFYTRRRSGYALAKSGYYKYLWTSDGQQFYGIHNSNLIMLDKNLIETTLISNVGDYPASFTQIADVVYFTNKSIIRSIQDGVVYTPSNPNMVNKAAIPPGDMLAVFNGLLLIIINNYESYPSAIIISDGGGALDRYDLESGIFPFSSTINMVLPVEDGVFISSDKIDFLSGLSPTDWEVVYKDDAVAIEGTAIQAQNIIVRVGDGMEVFPLAYIFSTNKGICICGNGGKFYNLTELVYNMPTALAGTSVIRKYRGSYQYIACLRA